MDGGQLKTVLTSDPTVRPYFRGIYARDTLYQADLYVDYHDTRNAIIVNTDFSSGNGKHWLLIIKGEGRTTLVDSWAIPKENYPPEILKFLGDDFETIGRKLQGNHANTCGFYIIYFAHFMCKGESLQAVLKKFDSNSAYNDYLVLGFYRSHFGGVIPLCTDNSVAGVSNLKCISLNEHSHRMIHNQL